MVALLPATSIPIIQVRVADLLMPMSILFGWPAVLGVTLGAGLGNLVGDTISGLPGASVGIDVVGGSLANLIAATLAWKISSKDLHIGRRRISWLFGVNTETAVITLTVGPYLGWIYSQPLWFSMAGILLGSIVAISVGGYTVLRILARPKTLDALASTGLIAQPVRSGITG